jgi:hypothetical protein
VLNRSFVCVYVNNEDYYGSIPGAPAEERKELERIRQEGFAKKLSVGDVRSYVLSADGHPYYIVPTDTAAETLGVLGQAVGQFKPTPGKPVVPPVPQSAPPPAAADAITLHLVSRGDDRGSWAQFPAENWIILQREDWSRILPAGDVEPGQTWEFDRDVSARILTYFYPQTENNNATIDRIQQYLLKAKVLTVKAGVVTARVDGFLRMQHVFYPGRTNAEPLGAEIVGVLTYTADQPPSLQLVTTQAQHGRRPFTVAVRTVPSMAR